MASTTTIPVSKNAIITILKDLPENILAEVFWETFVTYDDSPPTESEKKSIDKAKEEFKKRETVKWRDIR